MCAEFESCCVSCLCLLSMTYLTVALPWTKGTKEGDVLNISLEGETVKEGWVVNKTEAKDGSLAHLLDFQTQMRYTADESADFDSDLALNAELPQNKTSWIPDTRTSSEADSDGVKEEDMSDTGDNEMESLSVVWYLGAFGGLVTFFLVIVCSEFCFGNAMYRRHNPNEYINRVNVYADAYFPQTPPPPYHLFAPPTYTDTIQRKINYIISPDTQNIFEKESFDCKTQNPIFIVPVHQSKVPSNQSNEGSS